MAKFILAIFLLFIFVNHVVACEQYDLDNDSINDEVSIDHSTFQSVILFGNGTKKEFTYPEVFMGVEPKLIYIAKNQINLFYSFPDRGTYYYLVTITYQNNNFLITKIEKYINMFPSPKPKMCIQKMSYNISEYENIVETECADELTVSEKFITNNIKSIQTINDYIQKRYFFAYMLSHKDSLSMLKKFPLSKLNLIEFNNIAYHLEQAKNYKESVYLLEKIIEKFPDRTVAYFNLGDAYYGVGDKTKAIKAYQTYMDQMKKKGWEKKIPKQVLDRVLEAQ